MATRDVVLTGPAGVGKDTVAAVLVERYGYSRVAFADALKDVLLAASPLIGDNLYLHRLVEAVGWDGAKTRVEVRRLLQAFGIAAREVLGSDVWVDALWQRVLDDSSLGPVVVTDTRMPNEWSWAERSLNDPLFVRLDRDGVGGGEDWRSHVSEVALPLDVFSPDLHVRGAWSPDEAAKRIAALTNAVPVQIGVPDETENETGCYCGGCAYGSVPVGSGVWQGA